MSEKSGISKNWCDANTCFLLHQFILTSFDSTWSFAVKTKVMWRLSSAKYCLQQIWLNLVKDPSYLFLALSVFLTMHKL